MHVAARQHGVVTVRQIGLTRREITRRVERGLMTRLHQGVYLAGPVRTPLTDAVAAVLACGRGAVLSHHAAATLWALLPERAGPIDVIVAGRHPRHRAGIRVHRAETLDPRDVTRRHGIPVTTPARTLLDLAATLPTRDLERAVEEAQVRGHASQAALDEMVRRHAGRRGAPALRAALGGDDAGFTRSEAERRMRALTRRARLPAPSVNARLHGYTVDFLWREPRLVVEVDGYRYHAGRAAFERDRVRDADLQTAGYRVIRITWRQLTREPEAVVARVARAL